MKKIILMCVLTVFCLTPAHAQTSPPPITPDNVTNLTEIHRIGDGIATKIVYSPTGDTFAVLSALGAWVYDATNPDTPPFLLDGHTTRANILAYSPDGQFLVTSGVDFRLQVWHIPSQKLARTIETHFFTPMQIEFRADGQILAMHNSFRVQFVSLTDGVVVYEQRLRGEDIVTIDFHPLGTQFVVTLRGDNPTITLYTISDPQFGRNTTITESMTLDIPTHESHFWLADYSADGTQLIGVGEDGAIAVWDTQTGERFLIYQAHDTYNEFAPRYLDVSLTGNGFISATERGYVKAWSNSGDLLAEMTIENLADVVLAPDGLSALILARPNAPFATIHRWDIPTNTLTETHIAQQWARVADMDVSPDGNTVALASIADMRLINTTTWEAITRYQDDIKAVAFHPTMPTIIAGLSDDNLGVWDLENDVLTTLATPNGGERDLIFSPDGETIATRLRSEAIIRHIDDQTLPDTLVGGQSRGDISTITYSPDANFILVTYFGDNQIEFWHTQTGELIYSLDDAHTQGIFDIAFHPNGDYFASVSDDSTLQVHHTTTYEAVLNIDLFEVGMAKFNRLTYSPDGRLLVGGGFNGDIFIIDAQTGVLLNGLFAHRATILNLEFSPDGTRLYSASLDGTVRVWAVPNA